MPYTTFDPDFAIETPRLLLSHFDPSSEAHSTFLSELYSTPESRTAFGSSGIDANQARQTIAGFMHDMLERNGYGPYLVSLKPASLPEEAASAKLPHAVPIGTVSLCRGAPPAFDIPDIGFAILPAYMRQGYTREACVAAMAHAASEYGVAGFLGFTAPQNGAAQAVFKSLGMVDHGVRPVKVFRGELNAVWASEGVELDSVGF